MQPPQDEVKPGAPDWMVTFADLMSLLLTFFVLLLSFSNMEIVKFRTMAGSVKNALGLKSEFEISDVPTGDRLLPHKSPKEGDGEAPPNALMRDAETVQRMVAQLREVLEQSGLAEQGTVKVGDEGVVLELNGDLLFESGKADIKADAHPVLDGLIGFIGTVPGTVDVEGHTDDVPIATRVYPSNWELSAARAGRAVRYLTERGVPSTRLRAIGHADSVPVADNATPDGRRKNRRVEFLFRADGAAAPEALLGLDPNLRSYANEVSRE